MSTATLALRWTGALVLAAPLPAQDLLLGESFENGFANWTSTGLWHVESATNACVAPVAPIPDGSMCAYYGISPACNFDTGAANAGTLTYATPIALPSAAPSRFLWLRTWSFLRSEQCITPEGPFDISTIEVSADGGATWQEVASPCYLGGTKFQNSTPWQEQLVDLRPFAGQSISLRLRFDSIDEAFNGERGWLVDDVSVRVEPGEPVCLNSCPCNQAPPNGVARGTTAHGCASSLTANQLFQGAALLGRGTPNVSADSVRLSVARLPPGATTVLLQGDFASTPTVFLGDGRLCLGGQVERRGMQPASSAGTVEWPGPHGTPLSGFAPIGASVGYQLWYRDPVPAYCTPSSINLSNAYRVTWLP